MLRVPELLRMILDELDYPDLYNLPSVSRHFWNQTTPLVWEIIPDCKNTKAVLKLFPAAETDEDTTGKVSIPAISI